MNFENHGFSKALGVCCLLAFAACSSSTTTLHIDLITTLSPGDEFDTIHLEVSDRFSDQRVDLNENYASGVRIATVDIEGNVRVRVVLFNDGTAVAMEDVFVTARTGTQVVRVEIVDGVSTDAGVVDAGMDGRVDGRVEMDMGVDDMGGCASSCDGNTYVTCQMGVVRIPCGDGVCRTRTADSEGGCFDRVPSNVGIEAYVRSDTEPRIFAARTWDTDDCDELPGFHHVVSDSDPEVCVLSFGSVAFENDHVVTGSRALVVVSAGNISIGSIAADGMGQVPGPGGRIGLMRGDVSDSVDGEEADNGGGGGGGGAAPSATGGRGGGPAGGEGGFSTSGSQPGVPLTSGGGGGVGLLTGALTAAAVGGGGGGALQFSARGQLSITGAINFSGGAGQSVTGSGMRVGGGGGGGGLFFLEAAEIHFQNASILGAGGGGGCMGVAGYEDGLGGPSCDGSWGGGAETARGSDGTATFGGGGGAGLMVLRSPLIMIEGLDLSCRRMDRADTDLTRVSP